jgi:hypothetical protein
LISVTPLLAHQALDNVSLLLNQVFCFTVIEIYFLLVVYSLYRELKGTAPPKLFPASGLQSVQGTEGNSTTNLD